ncbi:MAG: hypothetical protein M3Q69_08955 [Acidobacteriota bacterium]|nr:hypothetical protein [Acidobacteriota bacterium]
MALVNITVTPQGVIVNPPTVQINRVDQSITWVLRGGTWEEDGIVFDENPPAPFAPWPGVPAAPSGNNWVADAGAPLPHGSPAVMYRYTINIRTPEGNRVSRVISAADAEISIDPDVENQPQP